MKSVKELKEEYKKSFGTELRVYNGRSEADEMEYNGNNK